MSTMSGTPITMENGALNIPDDPIVHYIEGDGIGVDITPVMIDVVNAAVAKAYGGAKEITWSETLAGEKAFNNTGEWLQEACRGVTRSAPSCGPGSGSSWYPATGTHRRTRQHQSTSAPPRATR